MVEVASSGFDWWLWLRVASIGVKGWTQVVQSGTGNDERVNERESEEEFDDHSEPRSLLRLIRCPHGTLLDMAGLSCLTAGVDVDVAAGESAPRTNGIG